MDSSPQWEAVNLSVTLGCELITYTLDKQSPAYSCSRVHLHHGKQSVYLSHYYVNSLPIHWISSALHTIVLVFIFTMGSSLCSCHTRMWTHYLYLGLAVPCLQLFQSSPPPWEAVCVSVTLGCELITCTLDYSPLPTVVLEFTITMGSSLCSCHSAPPPSPAAWRKRKKYGESSLHALHATFLSFLFYFLFLPLSHHAYVFSSQTCQTFFSWQMPHPTWIISDRSKATLGLFQKGNALFFCIREF